MSQPNFPINAKAFADNRTSLVTAQAIFQCMGIEEISSQAELDIALKALAIQKEERISIPECVEKAKASAQNQSAADTGVSEEEKMKQAIAASTAAGEMFKQRQMHVRGNDEGFGRAVEQEKLNQIYTAAHGGTLEVLNHPEVLETIEMIESAKAGAKGMGVIVNKDFLGELIPSIPKDATSLLAGAAMPKQLKGSSN